MNPLSLSGMTAVGFVNDVPVWRPLLAHNKDEIFAFAHKYVHVSPDYVRRLAAFLTLI